MRRGSGISWKYYYFGTDAPSRRRQITVHSLMAFVLLCAYGLYTDFLPSSWWSASSLMATHVATIIGTSLLWWVSATGRIRPPESMRTGRRLFALAGVPVLLWGASWLFFARSLPDLVTIAVGSPAFVSMTLRKEDKHDRRACDRKVRGASLKGHIPGYICVPSSSYAALPAEGPMILVGTASAFGLHVVDVRPAQASGSSVR